MAKCDTQFNIKLPQAVKDEWQAEAERTGVSLAALITMAVRQLLDKNKSK